MVRVKLCNFITEYLLKEPTKWTISRKFEVRVQQPGTYSQLTGESRWRARQLLIQAE